MYVHSFYCSKCTRIEIHLLTPDGISPLLDVGIYGRIATMELFRPQVNNCFFGMNVVIIALTHGYRVRSKIYYSFLLKAINSVCFPLIPRNRI